MAPEPTTKPMRPSKRVYLSEHVRRALAEDERSSVLDVQVELVEGTIYLIGQVESAERRRAIEEVVREIVPDDIEVVSQLWVAIYEAPRRADPLD